MDSDRTDLPARADAAGAILMTPPGAAAIAVVRARGAGLREFLHSHFSATPVPGRAVHGQLRERDRIIDDPVVVLVDEITADLNLHGGPWVVRATLDLLSRNGFATSISDPARPLMPIAVDADVPIWQEVLADLPRARTELGVRMLLAQPAAWETLRSRPPTADLVTAMLADRTVERMLNPATVAIVGPANAGKSTLANRFFGTERSITADLPGTTRDWVGHLANLDGLPVLMVDTPGLRQSADTIEQAAIARAQTQIGKADVIVVLLDAARPMDEEQQRVVTAHPGAIVALNKSDLAAPGQRAAAGWLPLSAQSGEGVPTLAAAIRAQLGCNDLVVGRPCCWTKRQRRELQKRQQEGLSDASTTA